MARIQYWDFESPDSTAFLNNWLRGILKSGVYFGYHVVAGTTGMRFTLEMASDPDNSGDKLGKLITRDGVVIQEDDDVIDACLGTVGDPSDGRIDYLVATYVYNASQPSNQVAYQVLAGTAGPDLTPPTLNENQIIIATIYVPPGASTSGACTITDVEHKSTDVSSINVPDLSKVIKPGILLGGNLTKGTGNVVQANVARILSKEGVYYETEFDEFNVDDVVSGSNFRYDAIYVLSKNDDVGTAPVTILVKGTEGTNPTVPDTTAAIAAAAAQDLAQYDDADYFLLLGYTRVEGSGVSMSQEFTHTRRLLSDFTLHVSGGQMMSVSDTSGHIAQPVGANLFGFEGLKTALDLAQMMASWHYNAFPNATLNDSGFNIVIDGDFHLSSSRVVSIPSYATLQGVGLAQLSAKLTSSYKEFLNVGGWSAPVTNSNIINLSAQGVSQSSVPGGYQRIEMNLAGDVGDYGSVTPEDLRFAGCVTAGDPVTIVYGGASYTGWFESYTTTNIANTAYTISAIMPSGLSSRSPSWISIGKKNNGAKNVTVKHLDTIGSTVGAVNVRSVQNGVVDCITAPHLSLDCFTKNTKFGKLRVNTFGVDYKRPTDGTYDSTLSIGSGNRYDSIYVRQQAVEAVQIGAPFAVSAAANTERCGSIGTLDVELYSTSQLSINLLDSTIDSLYVNALGAAPAPTLTGIGSSISSSMFRGFVSANGPVLRGIDFFLNTIRVSTEADDVSITDFGSTDSERVVIGTTNGTVNDISNLELTTLVTNLQIVQNPWRYFKNIHEAYFEPSEDEDFDNDVVFLNTGLVPYTYNSTNGTITFSSAVNLSSVQPGDTFIGPTSTYVITIQSVNDGSDQLTVKKGFSSGNFTAASPASGYSGGIVRGAIRHKNTLLSAYSYNTTTGVVQFSNASVQLNAVQAGYLFRDGAGNHFEISAVTAASQNLTIAAGMSVDVTVSDAFSGSVVANVNPRGLTLNDASPSYGVEEIHFTGEIIDRNAQLMYTPYPVGGFTLHRHQRYHEFEDRRCAIIQDWVQDKVTDIPGPATQNPTQMAWYRADAGYMTRLSITAFMTGIVIGVRGIAAGSSATTWTSMTGLKIDGAAASATSSQSQTASMTAIRDDRPQSLMTGAAEFIHLPAGLHTIEMNVQMATTRIFIINQPLQSSTALWDMPGRCWEATIPYDLPMDRTVTTPTTTSVRGGRVIRYIPTTAPTTRVWAESNLTEVSTTGTANSDTTISGVASTAGFSVGDIIMLDSGSNNEYAVITVVGSGQFTVNNSVSFSGSTTIKFAGRVVTKQSNEELQARLLDNAFEEPAESFTSADFFNKDTPGGYWLDPANGVQQGGYSWGGQTYICGNLMMITGDGQASDGLTSHEGFEVAASSPSSPIRIGFVGTGLALNDMRRGSTGTLTVRVDGIICGTVDLARHHSFLPICSQLSYGFHTVELTQGTVAGFKFRGFTTYQPKTPVIDGVPVYAMNRMADLGTYPSQAVRTSDLASGDIRLAPVGVVNFDPGAMFFPQETSSDSWQFDNTLTCSESNGFSSGMNGESASTTKMDGFIWFYGQTMNIVWRSDSTGTAPGDNTTITVLDHDGTFRAPSSATGDTCVTAGGLSASSFAITTAEAQRYTIKFDNVGMHCVKLNGFANNLSAHIIGIEVHSPFYSLNRVNNHILGARQKYIQTFNDLRKKKPITKIGLTRYGGTWNAMTGTLTNGTVNTYLPVTSRGGTIQATIQGKVSCSGGAPVNYTITCLQNGETFQTLAAGTSTNYLSATFQIRVPRGTHVIGFSIDPNTNRTDNIAAVGDIKVMWHEVATPADALDPYNDEPPRAFIQRG